MENKQEKLVNGGDFLLRAIGLLVISVTVASVFVSMWWNMIIPRIFVNGVVDTSIPGYLTFFKSTKLVIFICIFAIGNAVFYYSRNKVKEIKLHFIIQVILLLAQICAVSAITGVFVYLTWGWIAGDIFSGSLIEDRIDLFTSILLSFLFFVILASDNLFVFLLQVLGLRKR